LDDQAKDIQAGFLAKCQKSIDRIIIRHISNYMEIYDSIVTHWQHPPPIESSNTKRPSAEGGYVLLWSGKRRSAIALPRQAEVS
jgi:hypothetical protein